MKRNYRPNQRLFMWQLYHSAFILTLRSTVRKYEYTHAGFIYMRKMSGMLVSLSCNLSPADSTIRTKKTSDLLKVKILISPHKFTLHKFLKLQNKDSSETQCLFKFSLNQYS